MGGSGGSVFHDYNPKKLSERIRQTENKTVNESFEVELSDSLTGLLAYYNDRDTETINTRLSSILGSIDENIDGHVNTLFGGSVSKHTYVDGLSDIDSLIILDNSDLVDGNPSQIIQYIADLIKTANADLDVETGNIAITISYDDGMSIQLLPALKTEEELRVPSWKGNTWSNIEPERFGKALTKRNEKCGMKLVPMIKLAKAINAGITEELRLTGYHLESLAIEAFRGYKDSCTLTKMLPHFFDRAKDLVLSPIVDKSGQSLHVDEYLGEKNSAERTQVSHVLNRLSRRMKNATAANAKEQCLSLFED